MGGTSVVVEEATLPRESLPILPEEEAQVSHAVLQRKIEFSTGRWCARRALTKLNIDSFILRNGPDRAPQWPEGVVGSITHTSAPGEGYCGVAVARSQDFKSIGIDAESAEPLDAELWPLTLTSSERLRLDRIDMPDRGRWAKLIFSSKECFYKAQFPLSRRFLGFGDVEVVLDPPSSAFQARVTTPSRQGLPLDSCYGRYTIEDGLIVTGIALRA